MKQLSQKEFEKCPKWLKKPKTFHSKLETLRYETIPITFHLNFVGEKLFIILSVSVLSVSVSADMKIIISVFYRYRPIWKKAYRSYTDYPMQGLDLWLIGASWHSEFGLFFNEEFYDLSQPWLLLLKDQAIIKKKM